jgi:hypothetical protein
VNKKLKMHIIFDTSSVNLDNFLHNNQFGGSANDNYLYFKGIPPYQRGYGIKQRGAGIGDIMRGVWRFLLPFIKKAGTEVSREAISTGSRILNKMDEGGRPEIVTEIKKGLDNVYERGGMSRQYGTGKGIKGQQSKRKIHSNLIGKAVKVKKVKLKRRGDIFSYI